MAKPSRADVAVEKVAALRDAPNDAALSKALNEALGSSMSRVVLAAAKIIEERELEGHGYELCDAFERLLSVEAPAKDDPGCRAKSAVLRALLRTEGNVRPAIYELGVRFVQREGAVDTAAEVRGHSALGLNRCRHADAVLLTAELLADPEKIARIGAADALAEAPRDSALPLLRYKMAMGDSDAEVMGAVFASFLAIDAAKALELAGPFFAEADEVTAEAVVLAIGGSRAAGAFAVLRDFSVRAQGQLKQSTFVAIALLRDEAATAHLLEAIATGAAQTAAMAVTALSHFKHDEKLTERVRAALVARREPIPSPGGRGWPEAG